MARFRGPRRSLTSGVMRLSELDDGARTLRVINLETSVTRSDRPGPRASITGCIRATRHALPRPDRLLRARQQPRAGLGAGRARRNPRDAATRRASDSRCGSGSDAAQAPAILQLSGGGSGCWCSRQRPRTAGVPRRGRRARHDPAFIIWRTCRRKRYRGSPPWCADTSARAIAWSSRCTGAATGVMRYRAQQRAFAHALIDEAGVDVVHGHSSHHVKDSRGLPRSTHPVRLRRLPQRLRRHRGPRGVPRRTRPDVFPHDGSHERGGCWTCRWCRPGSANSALSVLTMPDRRWLLETARREYRRFGCDLEESASGAFALRWQGARE